MTLGERMKEYEFQSRTRLLKRTPVVIRLDGKSFHTFTRGLEKPFDEDFINIMQNTMLELCENIQGCVLGYVQSDEITLVLIDYQNRDTCAWFDNQVQKIVSVSAAMATLSFNRLFNELWIESDRFQLLEDKRFKAVFDSRVFNLPKHEVINNLIWRQQDATRNSINGLAQSLFPHKELQGIKSNDLQDKMLTEKDVNWNNLPTTLKRGSCAIKKDDGSWFIDNEIPIFTENRNYINDLLFIKED